MTATAAAPRKSTQVLIWLFAVLAVFGIALLTSTADPAPVGITNPSAVSSSRSVNLAPAASFAPETLAAGSIDRPANADSCTAEGGTASLLPAMRWSDFNLSLWDNGFIVKADSILSSIASFLFFVGDLKVQSVLDDVIMTNGSRDDVLALKEQAAEVLAGIGLRLSEAKTRVTRLSGGIDFLGFHIQWRKRRGGGKWYCMVVVADKTFETIKQIVRTLTPRRSPRPLTDAITEFIPLHHLGTRRTAPRP